MEEETKNELSERKQAALVRRMESGHLKPSDYAMVASSDEALAAWMEATVRQHKKIDDNDANLRAGIDLAMLVAMDCAASERTFDIRAGLAPILRNLLVAAGCAAHGWADTNVLPASGLTMTQVKVAEAADPEGFRRVMDAARNACRERREREAEDLLADRVKNGVRTPVVVKEFGAGERIQYVQKHSDTLLVRALSDLQMEKKAETFASSNTVTTNIGSQVVYNVELPGFLAKARKKKVLDITEDADVAELSKKNDEKKS